MIRLVRVELAKLRTTHVLSAIAATVAALTVAFLAIQLRNAGTVGAPSLGTVDSLRDLLQVVGVTLPIMVVVGVLTVTSEFRHRTLPASLLAVPHRGMLLAAKAAAAALVGVGVAIGGLALELAIVVPYLAAAGVPVDLANGELLLAIVGVLLGIPLYAVAGVGIGAIVRNQTAAVTAPLVWLVGIESLLPSYGLDALVRWLPGGATSALGRAEAPGLLPMWAGGLLLAAYVAVLVVGGAHRVARADV